MTSETVHVDPDDKHILSATTEDVILKGVRSDDEDNDYWCVLFVPRPTYLAAIAAWLDHKMDYSTRWNGEWCGVGSIAFDAHLIAENSHHLLELTEVDDEEMDNLKTEHVPVNSYSAATFEIEMEHG